MDYGALLNGVIFTVPMFLTFLHLLIFVIDFRSCVLQVLEEHELSCMDLLHVNTDGVILTKKSKKLE